MNDTQTRLLINPITKTIIPKYRNQQAVYIAKGDHKSVRIIFELPRYVDGYDMSDTKNLINIHFVNLSEDGENYSKGVSEAISREIEGDKLSFAWLVDERATRYAGVVSVGITVEQYDNVDGKAQEVYSWSTAPYNKTIVWDSHDNTAEATEQEYDYLVQTVDTLVTLSLQNKLSEAEKNIDNKVAQAQSQLVSYTTGAIIEFDRKASGAIDNFDRNANEALEKINNSVAETARNAEDADGSAHLARDRMELAKSWAVGDTGYREGENTDNAKYYSEETEKQVKLAQQTVEEAQQTVAEAQSLRDDVQVFPPIAEWHARTAESWAKGGTGIREGEDTDNAKYYSEQIGNSANEAKNYAQEAEQYANDAEAASDLARQHSNASGSYATASEQFANEAKGYAEQAADEANNANVAKSETEQIAEQTRSYVGEAQQHAEEAQQHARDSGVSSMTAGEYAEESRNSANEAKGYAEQAQNAVVGINTPYANALKGEASGEMVSMKDVSPVEHKINVKLSSKNLIDVSADPRFTKQDDGSYVNNIKIEANKNNEIPLNLPYGTYILSYDIKSQIGDNARLRVTLRDGTKVDTFATSTGDFVHVETPITGEIINWGINYGSIPQAEELTIKNVQLEPGTVATPYRPFVDVGKAKLYKTGKDLLDIDNMLNEFLTKNGDEYTLTRTENKRFSNYINTYIPAGTPLIFSTGGITSYGVDNIAVGLQLIFEDGTSNTNLSLGKSNIPRSRTYDKNVTRMALYVNSVEAIGTPITIFTKPMLEVDTVATEYEPYIEPIEVDKDNVTSLYPTTTLYSDTPGVLIEAEYNKDLNKVIAEIYNAIANL